jgi:hypothetical protein
MLLLSHVTASIIHPVPFGEPFVNMVLEPSGEGFMYRRLDPAISARIETGPKSIEKERPKIPPACFPKESHFIFGSP